MKRSFLLLEVLIAIALLTSVAAFLFYHPISFLKQEKVQLEEIAKTRLFQQTIEEIRILLFKNELPFAFNENNKAIHQLKKNVSLKIKGFKELEIKRYYRLWFDPKKSAPGHYGQSFNLMHLEVSFEPPLPDHKNFPKGRSKEALFFVQQMSGVDNNSAQNINTNTYNKTPLDSHKNSQKKI